MNPLDIIWIKNVNYDGAAYMDVQNDFHLHFPGKYKTNPGQPSVNEIILLFQNINKQKVFTHLVTPTDDGPALEDENRTRHPIYRKVRMIARTPQEKPIPVSDTLWKDFNFGGFSQGNVCKIANIKRVIEIYGKNHKILLDDVWNRFLPYFN